MDGSWNLFAFPRIKGFHDSITLDVEVIGDHANVIGESLRRYFFDQSDGQLGCYSTFKINDWVEELPSKDGWSRLQAGDILAEYRWDEKGRVRFLFGDHSLENPDCENREAWILYY